LQSDSDFVRVLTESHETLKYTVFMTYAECIEVKSRRYMELTKGLEPLSAPQLTACRS